MLPANSPTQASTSAFSHPGKRCTPTIASPAHRQPTRQHRTVTHEGGADATVRVAGCNLVVTEPGHDGGRYDTTIVPCIDEWILQW